MHRLALLVAFLTGARALHLVRDANASCGTMLLDNSQTSLYNTAFEVSPDHIVKNWQYEFLEDKAPSREKLLAKSCVNMSYVGRSQIPAMLLYGDLSHIAIEKIVCVYPGAITENISIRNIPFFEVAFANVSASMSLENPHTLLVRSSFDVQVPWMLVVWQGVIVRYAEDLMAKYTKLLIAQTCVQRSGLHPP
jgi:hypothetical protein